MSDPQRPESVPAGAFWSEEEDEWVFGEFVDDERHGEFQFWRPDGTLCCVSEYEHGVASGPFSRYHENGEWSQRGEMEDDLRTGWIEWQRSTEETTENTLPPHAADAVWKTRSYVEDNVVLRQEYYDRDDERVALAGLPLPARPDEVHEWATYDHNWQRWQYGPFELLTGTPIGTFRNWRSDGPLYEEKEFEDGVLTVHRRFYRDGSLWSEKYYEGDQQVEKRGYRDDGSLEESLEVRDDGAEVRRWFFEDGSLQKEIVTAVDGTTEHTDYYETGEVLARHEPTDDEGVVRRIEYWPSGEKRAEGPYAGRAGGEWTVYDASGAPIGTADMELLCFPPGSRVFEDALGVHKAQQLEESALIDELGVEDWRDLETWFGNGEQTRFYLNALTSDDEDIFGALYYELYNQTHHQGTFSDATGPAARLIGKLLPEASRERKIRYSDYLAHALGREEYSLQAAHQAKSSVVAVAEDDPADQRQALGEDYWVEGSYWDVVHVVSDLTPTWVRWLEGDDDELAAIGARMIGFAIDDHRDNALATMLRHIAEDDRPALQAELVVGLVLMQPWTDEVVESLDGLLESDDELLRVVAALNVVRVQTADAPRSAIHTVVDTLADPSSVEQTYYQLYWTGWDLANELSYALAALGEERATEFLPRMAELLESLDAIAAIGIASAMLDIVYPEGYDEEPLGEAQRYVIEAIADSENVWTFNVNMHEVLRHSGLPANRGELRGLL